MIFCGFAGATDIAYVLGDVSTADGNIVDVINDLGYSYDLIYNFDISSTNFSEYGMILVWDDVLSNFDDLPIGEVKSFVANTYYLEDWGIADYAGSSSSTGYFYGRVRITNIISQGLVTPMQLYDVSHTPIYYLPYYFKRAPGLENVISTDNYHTYPIIGIINSGGELYGGGFADERMLFFGLTITEAWTSESRKLFGNSLGWVLLGEDGDDDGFHYDEDCDDSDENIWQFLSGYFDEDGDGFGSGWLIDVCSGEEISTGYSQIDSDCNDFDSGINPDAEEIPYSGVDENCNGFDLADVDGDGFDSDIIGGVDCDDNDELFSPASEDIYKNCLNDAPIVEAVSKIVVQEADEVVISVVAVDSEDDFLIYSINDSRFIQDENIFSWQTVYADSGSYLVEISVSDGVLDSSIVVEIQVDNLNRVPICDEIPAQSWAEDNNYVFDLSEYCYDLDGEYIGFYLNDTSEDKNISLLSLVDGIVNFSSADNWFGEDWIVFLVSDGKSETLTNVVSLNVTPVNDAPVFSGEIGNIEWAEDVDLVDEINLNGYFSDVDFDYLEFGVFGNSNISIVISDGLVSFYPSVDWFGDESVIFSVNDGLVTVYSNEVLIEVVGANEPPVFGEMICELDIDEDASYSCELNASDVDSVEFFYSIVDEDNIGCEIVGNSLEYVSEDDYNGVGSCLIRVSDGVMYDDFLLEVSVGPVNDAPVIRGYSPQGILRFVENSEHLFLVNIIDVDSSVGISWLLDDVVGDGNSYLFSQPAGNYELGVIVSDGDLNVSHSWDVFVGGLLDFSCSDLGGKICSESEICSDENSEVLDTSNCCFASCLPRPPEFSDINRCETVDASLDIRIKEPGDGDEFNLQEKIGVEVRIGNDVGENVKFDIKAYLYDVTDENWVEKAQDSVSIHEGKDEIVEFDLDIPNNLEVDNNYAVFVKVFGDDYCNEDYVFVDINKEEHDVIIESLKFEMESLVCGDYVSLTARVSNIGERDEDVYFVFENDELNISERTEVFELNENDDKLVRLGFRLPKDAEGGDYNFDSKVVFDDGVDVVKKMVILDECKILGVSNLISSSPINLNGIVSESMVENSWDFLNSIILIVGLGIFVLLFFWWIFWWKN